MRFLRGRPLFLGVVVGVATGVMKEEAIKEGFGCVLVSSSGFSGSVSSVSLSLLLSELELVSSASLSVGVVLA